MTTPTWNAAAVNQPPQAGQLNQLLGAHAVAYLYDGTQLAGDTNASAGNLATNGLWIDQPFVMSGTAIGRVEIACAFTGTGADVTLGIYADDGAGNPTGTALVVVTVPADFFPAAPAFLTIPMPVSGLTNGLTYHLVMSSGGDATNHDTWSREAAVSGLAAKTATSFAGPWTAQTFTMRYKIIDVSSTGDLRNTYEDAGARWTSVDNNAAGQPTILREYTGGQGTVRSVRSLTYSSGQLAGVA